VDGDCQTDLNSRIEILHGLYSLKLFCNYAAGYAVSGVAGGIGLHVVGFGVDYDRGAAVAEEGMGAVAKSHVVILQLGMRDTFVVHVEIFHVAGMVAFGILQAVFLPFRIEVGAGRLEIGAVALGILMKVDGMLAERKIVKVELEHDALSVLRHDDRARGLTAGVFDCDFDLGCGGKRGDS
jgi:hypothetical protein